MNQTELSRIAIITDTNSGITQEEAAQLGIFLLPMPFFIQDELFLEGKTLSQKSFYEAQDAGKAISTSQPSPANLTELWEYTLSSHDTIIYIPMSSGLSGSCATAQMLAADYEGKVFVADNKRISATQRQSVLDALTLRDAGYTAEQIKNRLEETALDANIYLTVETLSYLKKGGRITPAAAALGSALNILPVLQIKGERLDAFRKVRGQKKAYHTMLEAIRNDLAEEFREEDVLIQTAYSGSPEKGAIWNQIVQDAFPEKHVENFVLPLSIACHTGPGTVGVTCMKPIKP
ncbi:MAG: DegV family protein [Lachnospiraceae bacterium]|nr:DegV family protein [Lachnospiraceae bacterium]